MKSKERPITSAANTKYKTWLACTESKGIKKHGLALVSGSKLVLEAVQTRPNLISALLLPPKGEFAWASELETYRLSKPLYDALDVLGTRAPLAVVHTPVLATWQPGAPPQGLEVIVALSDPANLGALIRSAEAFGVNRVILTQEAASAFLPKAIKAASLACFRQQLAQTALSLADLEFSQPAIALDMAGEDISRWSWPRDLYLVLGEEGRGVPERLNINRLRIPMQDGPESLNATVAAAIGFYSYYCFHTKN